MTDAEKRVLATGRAWVQAGRAFTHARAAYFDASRSQLDTAIETFSRTRKELGQAEAELFAALRALDRE